MDSIFQFFGASGEASAELLLALILEPLLYLLGYIAFLIVTYRHYRKTGSKGALLILLSLLLSAITSVAVELLTSNLDDINYGYVELASRFFEAVLYLLMVYGVYLICNQATASSIANK